MDNQSIYLKACQTLCEKSQIVNGEYVFLSKMVCNFLTINRLPSLCKNMQPIMIGRSRAFNLDQLIEIISYFNKPDTLNKQFYDTAITYFKSLKPLIDSKYACEEEEEELPIEEKKERYDSIAFISEIFNEVTTIRKNYRLSGKMIADLYFIDHGIYVISAMNPEMHNIKRIIPIEIMAVVVPPACKIRYLASQINAINKRILGEY
jgi:hypothetical protein